MKIKQSVCSVGLHPELHSCILIKTANKITVDKLLLQVMEFWKCRVSRSRFYTHFIPIIEVNNPCLSKKVKVLFLLVHFK